ncbi:hypothetical protein [Microbacterium sp. JB110]|uniref:hypothetical protein n=1 Tax=Microbacterium sp. JB110 TaxID=2024477 RepID=UPI000B35AEFD|nr:hypothetical protein [Microbacterium sp. JB110]RCS60859.1 hypothetical protein CIK77_09340 [Microbacterium sp. JB110]
MIIWRGWGALGVIFVLIGAAVFIGIGTAIGSDLLITLWLGLGLLVGGAAAAVLGWYMNVTRPAQKTEEWVTERTTQLQQVVQAGQFQVAPGIAPPSSIAEAQSQADQLVATEREQMHKSLRNRHTIYYVPMQWIGAVGAIIGIVLVVVGLIG